MFYSTKNIKFPTVEYYYTFFKWKFDYFGNLSDKFWSTTPEVRPKYSTVG